MSQRVQNRVNAGLAALSATAVVAAPALAVTHAQVQAPEVLRSATAIQLAALEAVHGRGWRRAFVYLLQFRPVVAARDARAFLWLVDQSRAW